MSEHLPVVVKLPVLEPHINPLCNHQRTRRREESQLRHLSHGLTKSRSNLLKCIEVLYQASYIGELLPRMPPIMDCLESVEAGTPDYE